MVQAFNFRTWGQKTGGLHNKFQDGQRSSLKKKGVVVVMIYPDNPALRLDTFFSTSFLIIFYDTHEKY